MANSKLTHICIILQAGGDDAWVFQVPIELQVQEFISSLAVAINLPFRDRQGRSIGYVLQHARTGEFLRRDQSLLTNGILHADALVLSTIQSPGGRQASQGPGQPASSYSLMGQELRSDTDPGFAGALPTRMVRPEAEAAPLLQPEFTGNANHSRLHYILAQADEYKEAGDIEAALRLLLNVWWADHRQGKLPHEKTDPPLFTRLETFWGLYLGIALQNSQAADNAFQLIQEAEAMAFFGAYQALSERLLQQLIYLHRQYVVAENFDIAQLASLLAIAINPNHQQALSLQNLIRDYIAWRNSTNPKERVRLAQAIYHYDQNYGNIARDLMRSEDAALAARQSRNR